MTNEIRDCRGKTLIVIMGLKNHSADAISFHFDDGSTMTVTGQDDPSATVIYEQEISPSLKTIFHNTKNTTVVKAEMEAHPFKSGDHQDMLISTLTLTVVSNDMQSRKNSFRFQWLGIKHQPDGNDRPSIAFS